MVVELIAVVAGEWLEEELGLEIGTVATVKWLVKAFACDKCGCMDLTCEGIEVNDEYVGCECSDCMG